MTPNVTAVR